MQHLSFALPHNYNGLPCSPVKVPQSVGMLGALDTPKVSDKHLVTRLPSVPSPPVPPISLFTDAVSVAGPVITKVSKSSRIWQILVLALQIWAEHPPVGAVVSSKYVQFSVELDPQPNVTKYIKTIYYMESIRLTGTVKELKDSFNSPTVCLYLHWQQTP